MVYTTDPRVTNREADISYEGADYHVAGYTVTTDSGDRFLVLDASSAGFGWTICYPEPPFEYLMTGDGFAIGLPDAETAIRALLGPPQLAAVR